MNTKDKTAFQAAREGYRDAQAGKPPMNPYADDHETPQLAVAYDNGYWEGEMKEEHPSGLSGEHDVVLAAIHQESLHGR